MDILKFRVRGQALTLTNPNANLIPVTDTVNHYLCQFEFSKDWYDLNKVVVFKNVSYNIIKEVYLSTSNECYIPWEVLSNSGEIFLEVIGTEVRGEVVTVRISSTLLGFKWQIQEGLLDVSANVSPTPDLFEQFVDLVKGYSGAAIEARDEAVSAKDVVVSSVEAVDSAVAIVTAKVNEANVAVASAAGSANAASISETNAAASAAAAVGASEAASVYSSTAEEAAGIAELSKDAAVSAKADAIAANEAAEIAKSSAQTFASTAEGAASSALSSSNSASNSAQHAHASEQNAEQASLDAQAAKQKIEHMTATAVSLEPGSDPTVKKTETALGFNLEFGIPDGNVLFATFDADVSTGHLIMYTDEHFSGADFEINNNGHMEVII